MFPLHGLPFHLWICQWNQGPSPVISLAKNPSWSLWKASSSWQFCTLCSLFFLRGVRSLGTQCAQTFFILNSLWIIAWQRCCQLQFISGFVPFSMMWKTCCKADDWAVDRWLRLFHFLTDSCPVLKLSTHRSTVLWFGAASALTATSRWWVSAADMTVHFFRINV